MSTASGYMTVRGIDVDVIYKDIKNLHIGVYPPLGRVRVAAPDKLDDDRVRLAVIQRLPWIKRQRDKLRAAERQSEREMINGESHYVWGLRYRLKVVESSARQSLAISGRQLVLSVHSDVSTDRRRSLLKDWYRAQLREAIPPLIAKWEPVMSVKVPRWSVRQMKTKWGSCNRETGHIWFNLELAKKHPDCLEYIVVHEMAHHLERNHGERFAKLMDAYLPNWRSLREQLNGAPLGHEEWADREGEHDD